jgi:TPR repeat protein
MKEQFAHISVLESAFSSLRDSVSQIEDFGFRLSLIEKVMKNEVRSRRGSEVLFGTKCFGCDGDEEKVSERLGLSLLQTLANSKNSDAESEYGARLVEGRGCQQDIVKGVDFLKRSSESGNSFGEVWYGRCLESGFGVVRNEIAAAEYYGRSARSGNGFGEVFIGRSHVRGIGCFRDLKIAA